MNVLIFICLHFRNNVERSFRGELPRVSGKYLSKYHFCLVHIFAFKLNTGFLSNCYYFRGVNIFAHFYFKTPTYTARVGPEAFSPGGICIQYMRVLITNIDSVHTNGRNLVELEATRNIICHFQLIIRKKHVGEDINEQVFMFLGKPY